MAPLLSSPLLLPSLSLLILGMIFVFSGIVFPAKKMDLIFSKINTYDNGKLLKGISTDKI